jgi:hypothetical protein
LIKWRGLMFMLAIRLFLNVFVVLVICNKSFFRFFMFLLDTMLIFFLLVLALLKWINRLIVLPFIWVHLLTWLRWFHNWLCFLTFVVVYGVILAWGLRVFGIWCNVTFLKRTFIDFFMKTAKFFGILMYNPPMTTWITVGV